MRVRAAVLTMFCAAMSAGLVSRVHAQPQADNASEDEKAEAKATYTAGRNAFVAGDYEVALQGFQASYAVVASPNTRLMIARSLAQLRRYAEACRLYEETLEEAEASGDPKWKQAAKAALEEQTELLSRVGLVSVQVAGDRLVTLTVGGQVIPEDQWERPVPVESGEVEVTLDDGAGRRGREVVHVGVGEQASVAIRLGATSASGAEGYVAPSQKSEAPRDSNHAAPLGWSRPTWRTAGYVAAGVGVVGVGFFAVFGAMSQSTFDDLEKACPTKTNCDPALADDIDAGSSQQTVANVSLGVGAVALAAGAAALWIGFSDDDTQVAIGPGVVRVKGAL